MLSQILSQFINALHADPTGTSKEFNKITQSLCEAIQIPNDFVDGFYTLPVSQRDMYCKTLKHLIKTKEDFKTILSKLRLDDERKALCKIIRDDLVYFIPDRQEYYSIIYDFFHGVNVRELGMALTLRITMQALENVVPSQQIKSLLSAIVKNDLSEIKEQFNDILKSANLYRLFSWTNSQQRREQIIGAFQNLDPYWLARIRAALNVNNDTQALRQYVLRYTPLVQNTQEETYYSLDL